MPGAFSALENLRASLNPFDPLAVPAAVTTLALPEITSTKDRNSPLAYLVGSRFLGDFGLYKPRRFNMDKPDFTA